MSESERKLRTARHYLHHALLLVDEALKVSEPKPSKPEPERVPKWDPRWVETCPQRVGAHPMNAEAIRDHDERLSGAEDRL